MGKLNAGDLDQRVTIVTSAVLLSDGQGGYVAAGPDLENIVWAKVRTLRTAEKLALGQQLASEAIQVTLRAAPGVSRTTDQRVLWRDVTYAVQAAELDTRHEYVLLTCFSSGQSAAASTLPPVEPEPPLLETTGEWLSLSFSLTTNTDGGLFSGSSAPPQPAGALQTLRLGPTGSWFAWQLAGDYFSSYGAIISLAADPTDYSYVAAPNDFSTRDRKVQNAATTYGTEGDVQENYWIRLTRVNTDDVLISVSADGTAFRDIVTRPGVLAGIANPYIVGKIQAQANRVIQKTRGFGLLQ